MVLNAICFFLNSLIENMATILINSQQKFVVKICQEVLLESKAQEKERLFIGCEKNRPYVEKIVRMESTRKGASICRM